MRKTMNIAVGSDHRGHVMPLRLIEWIQQAGHVVEDVGTHECVLVHYADIASIVAFKVSCFGGEPPPELFAIGSQMTVLGISDAAFEPDFHGVLVDVQQGHHRSVLPLQDLEVGPKDSPNFSPVRELVVWYANR